LQVFVQQFEINPAVIMFVRPAPEKLLRLMSFEPYQEPLDTQRVHRVRRAIAVEHVVLRAKHDDVLGAVPVARATAL